MNSERPDFASRSKSAIMSIDKASKKAGETKKISRQASNPAIKKKKS